MVKDDATLVAEALTKGPEGFGPIIERYKDAVFAVALNRLRNFHDAEDITQNTFLDAFERLNRLNNPDRLGPWLRSLAIHRALNYLRRESKRNGVAQQATQQYDTSDAQFERRMMREQVLEALDRLNRVQRETVTLFYISGYSQQEIAGIQEVPVGTVKRRLYDARQKLKTEMVTMVKETLQEEAPNEEFAQRVYDLVYQYPGTRRWHPEIDKVIEEMKTIGTPGFDGFVKALSLPHWPTRAYAIHMIKYARPEPVDTVIDLLKRSLSDTNKHVRIAAGKALIQVPVDDARKRTELIPLVAGLMNDPSKRVRKYFSNIWIWGDYLKDVPIDLVVKSLANEEVQELQGFKRRQLKQLLKLEEHKEG